MLTDERGPRGWTAVKASPDSNLQQAPTCLLQARPRMPLSLTPKLASSDLSQASACSPESPTCSLGPCCGCRTTHTQPTPGLQASAPALPQGAPPTPPFQAPHVEGCPSLPGRSERPRRPSSASQAPMGLEWRQQKQVEKTDVSPAQEHSTAKLGDVYTKKALLSPQACLPRVCFPGRTRAWKLPEPHKPARPLTVPLDELGFPRERLQKPSVSGGHRLCLGVCPASPVFNTIMAGHQRGSLNV